MSKKREFIQCLRKIQRPALWAVQIGIFGFSGMAAFLLRFDFSLPRAAMPQLGYAFPIWVGIKIVVFRLARLDRGSWRYVSLADLLQVVLGNLAASSLGCVAIISIAPPEFPRSVFVIDLMICFLGTAGFRVIIRMIVEATASGRDSSPEKNTLIYGAGEAGVSLLREIQRNPRLPYRVRGFLDDWPDKKKVRVLGVPVHGGGDQVGTLAMKYNIDTVLIAIPSASGAQMTRILRCCQDAGVSYKTVPGLGEIIEGKGLAKQVRDVAVDDLLGRIPARLDEKEIFEKIQNEVILVTGAGGSIGSELCRQIARFRPKTIVGYEVSENALFHLDMEMKERFPGVLFHPEIGSVQRPERLAEVLEHHQPSTLYHAAAYKHVPMMEANVFEALENNVFGTYMTALAAAEHGVEDFVMISTDKAVRPTSIMGVTKRLAELAVNSLQNGGTRFVCVRFGNVLGSNGSVIPLFKKQIAAGGPVTVTHPEMQRYFMTIPEASQLVLQSSTMGRGGEIFVLDMGEPVKIVDLARNLILLSGLRPDEDIRITFTGIRPGEKLYEELHTFEESTVPTRHEKINIFAGQSVTYDEMTGPLEKLRQICAVRDVTRLILQLKEIVPEYNPSSHVLQRALLEQHQPEAKKLLVLAAPTTQ